MTHDSFSSPNGYSLGDMPPEEFRKYGHKLVDWVAGFLEHIEQYPVLSEVKPGDIRNLLPKSPPDHGESMESITADIDKIIMPGMT
ncbi:MAG: hypothetical protein ACE5JB_15530, partial [bacterium]